jgi:hypothetical protein
MPDFQVIFFKRSSLKLYLTPLAEFKPTTALDRSVKSARRRLAMSRVAQRQPRGIRRPARYAPRGFLI